MAPPHVPSTAPSAEPSGDHGLAPWDEAASSQPRIEVLDGDVRLDGVVVGKVAAIEAIGKPQRLDDLDQGLRARIPRGAPSSRRACAFRIGHDVPPLSAYSVLATASFAGCRPVRIASPRGFLEVESLSPEATMLDAFDRLLVVRTDARRAEIFAMKHRPSEGVIGAYTAEGPPRLVAAPALDTAPETSELARAVREACAQQGGCCRVHLAPRMPEGTSFGALLPALMSVTAAARPCQPDLPAVLLALPRGPSEPDAPAEAPTYPGRREPAHIQALVRAKFGALRVCYEQTLAKDPTFTARVTLRFEIDADGRVRAATSADVSDTPVVNGALHAPFVSCLVGAIGTVVFPPGPAKTSVTYPVMFSPAPR